MAKRFRALEDEFEEKDLMSAPIYEGLVAETLDPTTLVEFAPTVLNEDWAPTGEQVAAFESIYTQGETA